MPSALWNLLLLGMIVTTVLGGAYFWFTPTRPTSAPTRSASQLSSPPNDTATPAARGTQHATVGVTDIGMADFARQHGDVFLLIPILEEATKANDPRAFYELGLIYEHGSEPFTSRGGLVTHHNIEPDPDKAVEYTAVRLSEDHILNFVIMQQVDADFIWCRFERRLTNRR
jgi:hypothetical protein